MLDETLHSLRTTKSGKATIQGVPCYDMLSNPEYVRFFQYVPADIPNRNLMIQDDDDDESNDAIQCDIVKIALNMANLDESRAQKLTFRKDKAAAVLSVF